MNGKTVVVCNVGSPVEMCWVHQVAAVLQCWFSGQEAADALTSILFGKVSPSGKLTTTWPVRFQDTPAYAVGCPGENGKVQYAEGVYVGYRYFDAKGLFPLWCFGHGLSYSTFQLPSVF